MTVSKKADRGRRLFRNRFARMNLITAIVLTIVGILWLYPFLWSVGMAFRPQSEIYNAGFDLFPEEPTVENFARAWVKAKFGSYFFNTVVYSVSATAIIVVLSASCGYALSRDWFPGRDLIQRIILATLFIPGAAIIIPQFKAIDTLGLLNTRAGVILALVGGGGAFWVLLFKGFYDTIPRDIFDSAKIDGASFSRTFRLIVPLAQPIIGTVAIFSFMGTWNSFQIPLIYTLSRQDLRTLAVGMFAFQGQYTFDWAGFSAATVISFVPVLAVFLLFQGYFVRGLSGAVQGQ